MTIAIVGAEIGGLTSALLLENLALMFRFLNKRQR